MIRTLSLALLLTFMLGSCANLQAQDVGGSASGSRQIVALADGWKFQRGSVPDAAATDFNDSAWSSVTVPHTWNNLDGQDGGGNYFRGDGWYRRKLTVTPEMAGKTVYLRFGAANRRAEVFVNGAKVGGHIGGTQAFTVDISAAVKAGENVLAVRVNNARDDTPPLQADFTFFGGIYRPVELIAVDPLHIALTDYASPGIYVTTPEVTEEQAKVHVRALVKNNSDRDRPLAAEFLIADDKGNRVTGSTLGGNIAAGQLKEITADLIVAKPHRWNGVVDPYLYTLTVRVGDDNPRMRPITVQQTDGVSQALGIRTFSLDPDQGFILNGKPYRLVGVNRHQDRKDMGWAITNKEHDEDMALIKEMGCTSIRLAHYQHAEYFYQLCDKEGMVVWAEVPVVDRLGSTPLFTENAKQQYTELIRQNFNHPSIVFWSAGNEVDESGGNFNRQGPPNVYDWFRDMHALGKKEDPSRYTAAAWRERFFPPADTTDVAGLNVYFGWYNNTFNELEDYVRRHHENAGRGSLRGKWSMTEYGAGASISFHSENPVRMDHTEEYQNIYHEAYWKVLKVHPEVWGVYIWNMFDFAVDGRAEGDHAGINDKGVVTHDRKVKKDAFYFYKANWMDAAKDPFVYLTSRRFAVRGMERIAVKVYTNAPRASLSVNGVDLGEKTPTNGTIVWEGVTLRQGPNVARVVGRLANGRTVEDQVTWTYTPGAPLEVYEAQDERMRNALRSGPPRAR